MKRCPRKSIGVGIDELAPLKQRSESRLKRNCWMWSFAKRFFITKPQQLKVIRLRLDLSQVDKKINQKSTHWYGLNRGMCVALYCISLELYLTIVCFVDHKKISFTKVSLFAIVKLCICPSNSYVINWYNMLHSVSVLFALFGRFCNNINLCLWFVGKLR